MTQSGVTLFGSRGASSRCGLCGRPGKMTKAHVPPQSAGNTLSVVRYRPGIKNGIRGPQGPEYEGGIWLKSLCAECNNRAGERADRAYADFAARARFVLNHCSLAQPSDVPPVNLAPGLVSRSVLVGMMAVNPRLGVHHRSLAEQLMDTESEVVLPGNLQLRLALTVRRFARVAAAGAWMKVLGTRLHYMPLVEVWFHPFAWALVPTPGETPQQGLDLVTYDCWADVTEWSRFSPDRTSVDLRNLTRTMPVVRHPQDTEDHDAWVSMSSNEATIWEGRIPPGHWS